MNLKRTMSFLALCLGLLSSAAIASTLDGWKPFFRQSWLDSDSCERTNQTWEQYWGWIDTFFNGTFFEAGWFDKTDQLVAKITDPARQTAIRTKLLTLGRRVAAEWAKDNSCRKIRSVDGSQNDGEAGKPAVADWGRRLEIAANADSGSGSKIENAIQAITAELDAVLGGGAPHP